MSRLKQEEMIGEDIESGHLVYMLGSKFDEILENNMHTLFLKKGKKDFINDTLFFMSSSRIIFDKHFNSLPKSSRNPFFKLDALIWSKLFTEKQERYSNNVYQVAAYFISQYHYIM
jgi:hypothetical protein